MEMLIPLFIIASICSVMLNLIFIMKIIRFKQQTHHTSQVLSDIKQGNSKRRILVKNHELVTSLAFKMNETVYHYDNQLVNLKKGEELNKHLMTGLPHGVRTPFITLIGCFHAVQKGIVMGQEKDSYIDITCRKAGDLKEYTDELSDRFKIQPDDYPFTSEETDITETTRSILTDWILIFEEAKIDHDLVIPEQKILAMIDRESYRRAINNLVQNTITYGHVTEISLTIKKQSNMPTIRIKDKNVGISSEDLPYTFENLYTGDKSRSNKGSGSGLAIAQQLIQEMDGLISVQSELNDGTIFLIILQTIG